MQFRHSLLLPALLLFAGCPGGIDTPEEAIHESVSIMEDMADVLEGVKDKKTAEAAKGKLQSLKKRMDEVEKAMSGMKTPEEPDEATIKKLAEPMMKAQERLGKEMMRIAMNPELAQVLEGAMDGMPRGR